MHKPGNFLSVLSAVLLMLILGGCLATLGDDPWIDDGQGGVITEDSTLFEPLIIGTEVYQEFLLNDTRYSGGNGYTFWGLTGETASPFVDRTVSVNKYSGYAYAGYGIVVCHAQPVGAAETMLVVMINISREFIIGEVIGAQYKEIEPWTQSNHLKSGFNQANKIRLTRDAATGEFTLHLNDNVVKTFKPEQETLHTEGTNGFIVVISPQDKFPGTPVRVTYQEM